MTIFRGNDIRGIYGSELTDSDAYAIGNAFVQFVKSRKIVVGRDNRVSSPALHKSLVKGITDSGADVIDVGIIDSPGAYFASHHFKKPVIMITASHNPPEHNGFYLCKSDGEAVFKENGLKVIEKLVNDKKIVKSTHKGSINNASILPIYAKHLLSFVNTKSIKPIKIVIDAGNGVGAPIAKEVYKHTSQIKVIPIYFESDGSFPNRGPDTTIERNLSMLQKEVTRMKADFGIAFDGDADRVAFVDEKGNIIEGSLIGALLAQSILQKTGRKKENVVYTIGCSRIVPETIKKYGGSPVRERVGHSFVNAAMRKTQAIFGVEHTGHYFYRDNFATESPIITSLKVCEILSRTNKQISQLIKPYKKYYMTKEISFHVQDQLKVLENVKEQLNKKYLGKIETFDGLFVDCKAYWFRIRASQTEPLIRMVIEGRDKKEIEGIKNKLVAMIKNALG